VEKLGAGSGAEGVETFSESALEFVGSMARCRMGSAPSATPCSGNRGSANHPGSEGGSSLAGEPC
jgi:hypothetical protein